MSLAKILSLSLLSHPRRDCIFNNILLNYVCDPLIKARRRFLASTLLAFFHPYHLLASSRRASAFFFFLYRNSSLPIPTNEATKSSHFARLNRSQIRRSSFDNNFAIRRNNPSLENVTKGRIIRNDRLKIYFPRTTRERFEIEEEDLVFIPRKNGLWVMILNS